MVLSVGYGRVHGQQLGPGNQDADASGDAASARFFIRRIGCFTSSRIWRSTPGMWPSHELRDLIDAGDCSREQRDAEPKEGIALSHIASVSAEATTHRLSVCCDVSGNLALVQPRAMALRGRLAMTVPFSGHLGLYQRRDSMSVMCITFYMLADACLPQNAHTAFVQRIRCQLTG